MSFSNQSEFNSVGTGAGWGGFGGGFNGGWGGGGLGGFGLIGLFGLLGRRGFGGDGDDNCARETAILAAIGNAKDVSVAEARAIGSEICDVKSNVQAAAYAQAIQAQNLASEIKAQGVAFQIANDNTLQQLSRQIAADGDATRALINQNTIQDLRDQLHREHRRGDANDISIAISNSNAQAQLQTQRQVDGLHHRLDGIINQTAKANNDIINLGTMLGVAQTNPATNINQK